MRRGAVPTTNHCRDRHEHQEWDICADAAGVLQPLAHVEADDVQRHGNHQHPSETVSRKVRSCASAAPRGPIMYAAMEALASSRPGNKRRCKSSRSSRQ